MSIGLEFVYAVMALVVILSAVGLLVSSNAVYSVLALVLNFVAIAILYLILGAPFIALAQITVYGGAIMVLFLFVIMLLGGEQLSDGDKFGSQRVFGAGMVLIFLVEAGVFIAWKGGNLIPMAAPAVDSGSPTALGMELFSHYSLPFEITSIILLVAVVGAIMLTRSSTPLIRAAFRPKKKDQS